MSFDVVLNATGSALLRYSYPSTPYKPGASWVYNTSGQAGSMVTQFQALADQYKQYPVLSVSLKLYTTTLNMVDIISLTDVFNVDTVTYDARPGHGHYWTNQYSGENDYVEIDTWDFGYIRNLVLGGFETTPSSSSYRNNAIYTAYSPAKKPTLTITFADNKVKTYATDIGCRYPSVAYGGTNRISWSHKNSSEKAFQYPTVASETLYYKLATDATWTAVDVTGSYYYNMPSFYPDSDTQVQVYVSCTDTNGTTTNTITVTYTAKAVEPAPILDAPTLSSPVDTIVDATKVIKFKWRRASPLISLTSQEFEIRATGAGSALWTGTFDSDTYSFTLPADTLTAGDYQWRGRSYNEDDVAGSWSSWSNFTALAAPPMPFVETTNDPKPTVTWEADGQEAYQVRIGDHDTGTMFGTATTYTSPEFLPDGDTLVEVRVLNKWNLWSPWGQTIASISNDPGLSIPVISAAVTNDAVLTWSAVTGAVKYHIYRNGQWIAETTETNYTDPWSVGENQYFVRAELADYNYADSAPVTLNIAVSHPIIRDVHADSWISLMYTTEPVSQSSMSQSQTVSFMILSGSEYPVAEMSPHREQAVQINVAFRHGEEKIFEALLGRECFLKDQYGTAFRGVMDSISSSRNRFYTVCSAMLRRVAE